MRSPLGAQHMPLFSAHSEESNFCNKKCRNLMFLNNLRQNCVVLHDCNKNAGFTESQKQRQRGREPERESRRERDPTESVDFKPFQYISNCTCVCNIQEINIYCLFHSINIKRKQELWSAQKRRCWCCDIFGFHFGCLKQGSKCAIFVFVWQLLCVKLIW